MALPLSDHPERVKRVFVRGDALEVERIWRHEERLIFKFQGIDSISAAEKYEGADVEIPKEERAPLGEGEYYQTDLVGCEVVDGKSNRVLGVVTGWQEYGGPPLLELAGPENREILIPFAKSICREIDLAAKRIVVDLPEGLDEL